MIDENTDSECGDQNWRKEVSEANAGNEQEHTADGSQEQSIADIGFFEDQAREQADEQAGDENAAFPTRHLTLEMFAVPSQSNNEG